MKTKYFQMTFVILLAISILSGLFTGDVSQARAQSSRVWSDPINLSNSGGSSNPMFVVDTLGVMHAIWIDDFAGYRYTQSVDGITWASPRDVKYPFDTEGVLPMLMTGPNGYIYVFFQSKDKSLRFAQAHSATLDDPAGWGFQNELSANMLTYDVALDTQGIIHVAYIRNKDSALGAAGVYYARSSDAGRSWSTEKLLYASQYFRTTKTQAAHIGVSVSDGTGDNQVVVTWDNTSLKRIFSSSSTDAGVTWGDVVQLKGPDDTGGYNTPFYGEISISGQRMLLLWEVGEPGANQCNLYGQWSEDGGSAWGATEPILDNRSVCPTGVDIIVQEPDLLIAYISYEQGVPALIAWNGIEWSELQPQDELSYLANPATNEPITLGCQYHFLAGDRLYLTGCDVGSGGDIWIASRTILPASDWAFSTSLWSLPTLLTSTTQKLPSLTYASGEDYLHAIWTQIPLTKDGEKKNAIYYSRWNESQWLAPLDVIYDLNGAAGELSAATTRNGRLVLVWSDEKNGDLLFSWANSSKANSTAEWENPYDLPSPSQWTSSPDILADASGVLVVVYSVPFNEKRGIYMIRSDDNGMTWSSPSTVFDAEAAGWVMVNHPKVALDNAGRLHVLFTNYSGLDSQPNGLYYLQSADGGATWSTPDLVSESSVIWSDVTIYNGDSLHRIWQQDDGNEVANLDQESTDGGKTWGKIIDVTGVNNSATPVTLASNNLGEMHFIQLVEEATPAFLKRYNLIIQDWVWSGEKWENQPSQKISIIGSDAQYSVAAGISSKGYLAVSLLAEYRDLDGVSKTEIYNMGRSLSSFDVNASAYSAVIANSNIATIAPTPDGTQLDPSLNPTALPDLSGGEPPAINRNIVGIILILMVVGLTIFVFLRRSQRTE